jgi:hypothetical protein
MSETNELMVRFRRGVTEDAARKIAEASGGVVRRKMRTDRPDEIMLLVRVEDLKKVDSALKTHADVEGTEANHGGYRPM